MSRTLFIIIAVTTATLVIGALGLAALLFGRSYFTIANVDTQTATPPALVVETAVATSILPTATIAAAVTETAVPPTPFITPLPSATATA
ncbi:MAG: hypothetical protein R6X34_30155, partial [Chloroflexota bacterium]